MISLKQSNDAYDDYTINAGNVQQFISIFSKFIHRSNLGDVSAAFLNFVLTGDIISWTTFQSSSRRHFFIRKRCQLFSFLSTSNLPFCCIPFLKSFENFIQTASSYSLLAKMAYSTSNTPITMDLVKINKISSLFKTPPIHSSSM